MLTVLAHPSPHYNAAIYGHLLRYHLFLLRQGLCNKIKLDPARRSTDANTSSTDTYTANGSHIPQAGVQRHMQSIYCLSGNDATDRKVGHRCLTDDDRA